VRIDTEVALSRAALASGGDRAHEQDIVRTWIDYYVAAIHTTTDIEVGGSSKETLAAIDAARRACGRRAISVSRRSRAD
jgi:hypothetical protein